jgi:hypothetical protein
VSNPYQYSGGGYDGPPPKQPLYTISRSEVSYQEAINFALANRNWFVNCLLIGLLHCIPFVGGIVGPIVALGYLYGDYESLLRDGRPIPSEFALGKFMDYLQRGVMAFLAMLLVSLSTTFLLGICLSPIMVLGMVLFAKSEEARGILMPLSYVPFTFLITAITIFAGPIVFRVGLSGKFEEISNFKWLLDFVKAMWPQMLIGSIVISIISGLALSAGMLVCCVGLIPAIGYINYVNFHIQRQWYEIYVTKGGEPIPLSYEPFGK